MASRMRAHQANVHVDICPIWLVSNKWLINLHPNSCVLLCAFTFVFYLFVCFFPPVDYDPIKNILAFHFWDAAHQLRTTVAHLQIFFSSGKHEDILEKKKKIQILQAYCWVKTVFKHLMKYGWVNVWNTQLTIKMYDLLICINNDTPNSIQILLRQTFEPI